MTINRYFLSAALVFLISVFHAETVFSQSSVSLQAEIQNLETAASGQGVAPSERHHALVRLARLRQLSGDIENAARNWLEAAMAVPGSLDEEALLSCAHCLAAMGEWDRALIALEPLISKNIRARFLDTGIKSVKSGDTTALAAIAYNADFLEIRSEILFLLWKVSHNEAAERWRQRLVNDFPQTPEGRLAARNEKLITSPSPFWFFISGLDSLPLAVSEQRTDSNEQIADNREQITGNREQIADNREQRAGSNSTVPIQSTAKVQTGVFSREANAQNQFNALKQAGFSPSIEQRGDRWAVTVSAEQDAGKTIRELREAGFESFLIR